MNPDAGSMSELPDSSEPLDPPDVPRVARSGAALPGARAAGARRAQLRRLGRTTMSSSGNGDGSADRGVTRGGRNVGQLDASLEIAALATIQRAGADEQLRRNPPVSALGYVSADGTARIDDLELKRQAAAIEDFCAREGWELVRLVRDIQPATGRCLNRPALSYAIERLGRGDASALVVAELARLCRSVAELREIFDALLRADARLVSLEPEIDTGTEFGRAAARIERSERVGTRPARRAHPQGTRGRPSARRGAVHDQARAQAADRGHACRQLDAPGDRRRAQQGRDPEPPRRHGVATVERASCARLQTTHSYPTPRGGTATERRRVIGETAGQTPPSLRHAGGPLVSGDKASQTRKATAARRAPRAAAPPPPHPEPAGDYDPLERTRRRAPPAGKLGRYRAERHCPRGRD